MHSALVTPGLILCGITIQIAESCREAVTAVFARRTSERPQCVLQPFGQCNEALTAEHHLGMLPAGERQSEVIQPVCEPNAGYRDTEQVGISEVRQALLPRRMLLAEDHVAFRAM